jgi:hypothetical protein
MTIPPQFAWIVPVLLPLIIGLLIGLIVKRTVKLIFLFTALIIIFITVGYLSLTFQDIFDRAMDFLPILIEMGGGLMNVLPYSSITFIVGLTLGLWKG